MSTRGFGLATAASRPGPDFLVIGTKRGGTTSLFNYLLMHPGVLGLYPQSRGKKSTDYFFFKEGSLGERWYRSHFHTRAYRTFLEHRRGHAPVSGEASPYYVWDPRIAGRVHAVAPAVKSILLLRDPVERAWSHYLERRANGVEPLAFDQALEAEERRLAGERERMAADHSYYSEAYDWYAYRARGIYLPQVQNWLSVFPRDQLLVLRSEEMYGDVQRAFDQVCDFLTIPRFTLPTTKAFNASARDGIPADSRDDLANFYAEHNRALAEFLEWSEPSEEYR